MMREELKERWNVRVTTKFKDIEKAERLYEYWVYLTLIYSLLEVAKQSKFSEEKALVYQPTKWEGSCPVRGTTILGVTIWSQPILVLDVDEILSKHGGALPELREFIKRGVGGIKEHCFPDFIVTEGEYWKLDLGRRGLVDLGLMLIECKHAKVELYDISQFLWYVLAWNARGRKVGALVCQRRLSASLRDKLSRDLSYLRGQGYNAIVVEEFKLGDKERCIKTMKELVKRCSIPHSY